MEGEREREEVLALSPFCNNVLCLCVSSGGRKEGTSTQVHCDNNMYIL